MPSEWFRLPSAGTGTAADPYRPAHVQATDGLDGYAGARTAAGQWVARVYGSSAALNALREQADVSGLADGAAAALAEAPAVTTSAPDRSFAISAGR
jgi:hypothetical protein